MKCQWLVLLSLIVVFSINANAQIYKWVDKDGSVRYTDTPPPNSVKKVTTISNKKDPAVSAPQPKSDALKTAPAAEDTSPEALAKKRRELAEIEKKNKEQKDAEAESNRLNCASAKANLETYSQGGRIYKMNDKGEREYYSDQGLADGLAQAKQNIQKYCN